MFSGCFVALVTPMQADGSIDYPAWDRLIDWHIESGTRGLIVGGTTGESATLEDAELRELIERACRRAGHRLAVLAGAGTSSTATTVQRARWLAQLPIEGILVVTPAYNRPTQDGLYRHYAAVAEASSKPVVLYNVPARTSVDMLPATVARLSRLAGIVAIKEAVPGERIRQLVDACRPGFAVLSGDDGSARAAILAGAQGVVSVTANLAPRAMSDMIAAAMRGERERAESLDAPLEGLHRALFIEANPIPVKWALAHMGLIGSGIRLPLTELSIAHQPAVLDALAAADAFKSVK